MNVTQSIPLLAGMALMVMTTGPTTALAQETEVEVVNEHTGNSCNPCTIHLTGEFRLTALPSGVVVLSCEDEYEGTIGSTGNGEITWVGLAHGAPGCPLINCNITPGEEHWPITELGETRAGEEHAHLLMCMQTPPNGPEFHCAWEVHFVDTEAGQDPNHHYEATGHNLCANGTREVEGDWLQETLNHDELELIHHPVG